MLQMTCLLLALASSMSPAGEDGAAWIGKAEAHLYRWQKPGSLVHFDVTTDVLEAPIAAMERDLARQPDREASRVVDALKHMVVHGVVDTGSGAVQAEIVIECDSKDPRAKAAIDKMKSVVNDLVRGAFDGLPLHDPSLVAKGSSVVGAELQGDSVLVTLGGRNAGEETTLRIDRRSELPSVMDMPSARLEYAYSEVAPGHYAPTKLEIRSKGSPNRAAEYTWQNLGNLVFPESIRLSQGPRSSRLVFESVRVEAHPR
jgi:hypothetical protein